MAYQVEITDTVRGETRLAKMDDLDWHSASDYWWTEGNFCCDCNRGDVWTRAGGEEPGENDYPCGYERFHVAHAILEDGTLVKIDDALAVRSA